MEASPKTGRLHQIRAHFDHLGHPVLHDKIYGKEDDFFLNYIDKVFENGLKKQRHCLHSFKLAFNLGSEVFDAELGLPEDLAAIWGPASHSKGKE